METMEQRGNMEWGQSKREGTWNWVMEWRQRQHETGTMEERGNMEWGDGMERQHGMGTTELESD